MDLELQEIVMRVRKLKEQKSEFITVIRALIVLLWPIISKLNHLGSFAISLILALGQNQMISTQNRIHELNTVQRTVLGLELLSVEVLDEKRQQILYCVRQLQQAMRSSENLTLEQQLEATDILTDLDWLSDRIIIMLHKRRKRWNRQTAKRRKQNYMRGKQSDLSRVKSLRCMRMMMVIVA
jgi:hypothetical protein